MSVQTTCFEITNEGHLQEVETAAALASWRAGNGSFWIAVEDAETPEAIDWPRGNYRDPALMDALLERVHAARILVLHEAVFFELPIATRDSAGELVLSTFVCLDRLVVQLHRGQAGRAASSDDAGVARLASLPEPSISALVCALLVKQSVTVRSRGLASRSQARRLAAQMDEDPGSVTIDKLVALKREIRDLDEIVDEQLAIFTLLKFLRGALLDLVRLADLFQVAITNTESTDRAVDRLDRQAADLQARYDLHQQDKINRRLGVLTVLSAIFLPLTLLAGV